MQRYSEQQRSEMLSIARQAIESGPGAQVPQETPLAPYLTEPAACFVTLESLGRLRGCIGSLEPHRALSADIEHNARAAAFQDHRFAPLQSGEPINIEISILSAVSPLPVKDEQDLLEKLCPGFDGVVFQAGRYRSTFLPSVWETLPDPKSFMQHLKQKAGLPPDFWSHEVQIGIYRVEHFAEVGEHPVDFAHRA